MKTVFITVGEAGIAHHLLRGLFWKRINQNRNFRIVLIVPPQKCEEYEREFGGKNIVVEPFKFITIKGFERFTIFLALNCLRTKTVALNQIRKYLTSKGLIKHITFFLKRLLSFLFGSSRIFQHILRRTELMLPVDARVRQLFDQYHPDMVFSTVMMFSEMDVSILREAKRRNIKTIGMPRGWDNFTNGGIVRVVPDTIVVHNRYAEHTAHEYQYIPKNQIVRVGFPRNDWFMRRDLFEPRDQFLTRLGIDPQKRIIFFGAMEHFWFPHDDRIARVFDELVESGKVPGDCVMLFRPYPGSTGSIERLKGLRHVIPDTRSFTLLVADKWEMREQETAHLMNSISHSEMVVTVASTLAMDGIVLGKPAISVGLNFDSIPYWFSAARFLDYWSHWRVLLGTGGVRRVDTPTEFAEAIQTYLSNPTEDGEGRARVKEQFLDPCDGHAGERVADFLRKELEK